MKSRLRAVNRTRLFGTALLGVTALGGIGGTALVDSATPASNTCSTLSSLTGVPYFEAFTIFTTGALNLAAGDTGGAVGAGGAATLYDPTTGTGPNLDSSNVANLPGATSSTMGYSLVAPNVTAGSKFNLTNGDAAYAPSANATYFNNGSGSVTSAGVNSTNPLDFSAISSGLEMATADFSSLSQNMTLDTSNPKHFVLNGSSTTSNIFSTSFNSLAPSTGDTLEISAPVGSTVVINVIDSGTVSLSNLSTINLVGIGDSNVLWNFPNATSIVGTTTQWQGTILAPLAALNYSAGQIDGSVFAKSFTGASEVHSYPFTGAYCTTGSNGGTTTTTTQAGGGPTTSTPAPPVTAPSSSPSTTSPLSVTSSTVGTGAALTSSAQPTANATGSSTTLTIPSTSTGMPWDGSLYWGLVGGTGVVGLILLGLSRRYRLRSSVQQ